MAEYKIGSIIKGQVTGITKYGIFVSLDPYYNGLIHISEISSRYVRNINDYITLGETILAKVIGIDEDNLQIKLSIKDIDYKLNNKKSPVIDAPDGFQPIKEQLPKWVATKLTEINNIEANNKKTT
ncbi:MAG TPA: S1 RNA-binding domain-containing protein [Bacilli bacterium]|nr:S1 RNA-binding domain-containing protein [Bacilli bacterium]